MNHEKEWLEAENILCIRLDALGDVLMTTPALRALKDARPKRRITLLTSAAGAQIASMIPEVDVVISYESPWMKAAQTQADAEREFQMADRLHRSHFDAAIIFTVFSQNPLPAALLAFMAAIPLRLAYCRENPYQLLTNWVPERDSMGNVLEIRHEVRRQLDLVHEIGAGTVDEHLSLQLPLGGVEIVHELLYEIGLDTGRKWIVIHPGASAASRRYSPGKFAQAARGLVIDHGFQVLFTGAESEVGLVEAIRAEMQADSFSLAGQLAIEEFSALLSIAPVLISNNTGPVHIAAAVHTPVVDLYALTNPQHQPWKVPHRVLTHDVPCKFCYKSICPMEHQNCLQLIPPEDVVTATLDLLDEVNYRPHGGMGFPIPLHESLRASWK